MNSQVKKQAHLLELYKLISARRIDCVLDVGASAGGFARRLFELGYRGRIVSFEPLSAIHQHLCEVSRNFPDWIIADRNALGDEARKQEINIALNSKSSSLLPMLALHEDASPRAVFIGSESVDVVTLDSVSHRYICHGQTAFLKLDVQGFEDRVLAGAARTLENVVGMRVEMSFMPLYEGQKLYCEMKELIEGLGFKLVYVEPGFAHSSTGSLLQVHGIFFR